MQEAIRFRVGLAKFRSQCANLECHLLELRCLVPLVISGDFWTVGLPEQTPAAGGTCPQTR